MEKPWMVVNDYVGIYNFYTTKCNALRCIKNETCIPTINGQCAAAYNIVKYAISQDTTKLEEAIYNELNYKKSLNSGY